MEKEELEKRFIELKQTIGDSEALFVFCAFFDIPLDLAVQADTQAVTWEEYQKAISPTGLIGFRNGQTDMREVVKDSMTDEERWTVEWGIGDEEKPYSQNDYIRLDEIFRTYSSRLRGAGGMDALQEDTLRNCSKMRLAADKALAKGSKDDIAKASTLNKMIQDNLSSEQLRKKDAKPVEQARIDGIVEALAKKFGKGIDITFEDAVEICGKWLMSNKYPVTRDAADHMLLSIINCTRGNNDMPELDELPAKMKFDKRFATQFAEEPNEIEDEVFKYLNFARESQRPTPKGQ